METQRDYDGAPTVSMGPAGGAVSGGPRETTSLDRPSAQKCPRFRHELQEAGALSAEGKRFELLVRGHRTLVFKTSSIGRSDNLP